MNGPSIPGQPILLIDDEEAILRSLTAILLSNGFDNTIAVSDSRQVLTTLAEQEPSCVFLDLVMPHLSGQELLEQLVEKFPDLPVVVTTALNEVETAVTCMKRGAFDYLVKPIDENRILTALRRALELRDLKFENSLLKESLRSRVLKHPEAFAEMVTSDEGMFTVFRYLEAISKTAQPVMVIGETGVGKELIARAIHRLSERAGGFVPVNVAGLDDTLFADTLFGHAKGAYTGADRVRPGLIERAAAGTLFLDEIGDLSSMSQVKLLRLLQEREYMRLGEDTPRPTDARIVVATNRNLADLQGSGEFRKDLYYRLRSHHVMIPPLRQRLNDLPLLVDAFLDEAAHELNKKKPTIPGEAFDVLGAYHFPGNVRELKALVFDAVARHEAGVLSLNVFRQALQLLAEHPVEVDRRAGSLQFGLQLPTLKETRKRLIEEALRRTDGNQSVAAQLLGISRQALNKHLKSGKGD